MTTDTLSHRLRLVRPPEPAARGVLVPEAEDAPRVPSRRAEEVARANRDASNIGVDQLREVFAARVAESLEGGRSAILRPERRARLVDLATRMGIRPFDAHLVIALTQDAARQGELADTPGTRSRDDLTSGAMQGRADPRVILTVALILGFLSAMWGIHWFLRV
ncbi:MAG: hypothetical protein Tsb0013_21700 [Phycisphaerales bacterium]